MTFPEKSAATMIGALVVASAVYLSLVMTSLRAGTADDLAYQPLLVVATVALAALAAVSHVVLAVRFPRQADEYDERDREIGLRSGRVGGALLAVTVFTGLVLAMFEVPHVVLAHALLGLWVLAEITEAAVTIALYRRGA